MGDILLPRDVPMDVPRRVIFGVSLGDLHGPNVCHVPKHLNTQKYVKIYTVHGVNFATMKQYFTTLIQETPHERPISLPRLRRKP